MNNQNLIVTNDKYTVELAYNSKAKEVMIAVKDLRTKLSNYTRFRSDDGFYFSQKSIADPSQSVKLSNDKLIVSLNTELLCFDVAQLQLIWTLNPDGCPIFEFIDIEEDILLRGEIQIFRITEGGTIVWKTSGEDIWVNTNKMQ